MVNSKIREIIRPRVPFTALHIVWTCLSKRNRTILDVGCGKGEPMKFINRHKQFFTVGADIFKPYIDICKAQEIHNEYVQCNITALPFGDGSFDAVICLEVLEHLTRQEGLELISSLERIAKKQVIITTPSGKYEQDPYDDNPYQKHRYIWPADEFKKLGYKVITLGIDGIHRFPSWLQYPLWVMAGPFTNFIPRLAGQLVCIKNVRKTDG